MLSFLYRLLLKFNTNVQTENYYHHDGEQWGFNRKVDTVIWIFYLSEGAPIPGGNSFKPRCSLKKNLQCSKQLFYIVDSQQNVI